MITGNIIGFEITDTNQYMQGVNPATGEYLPGKFSLADDAVISTALDKAKLAFGIYRKWSSGQRAELIETIAEEIMALGDILIKRANEETGLPEARILGERTRTVNQLKLFSQMLRDGKWAMPVIDVALPYRQPLPRPDLRKMFKPIGPVLVFSASNFPLAFSTAGGDTASALAAGCPVIVKAHSAHPGTNALVGEAILNACKKCNAPDGLFSTVYGSGSDMGQKMVADSRVKGVGFTGSLHAGRAIMDTAARRPEPIPVHCEMGSLNPVFILSSALAHNIEKIAEAFAGSISLGVGQFCTKPGLLFVEDGPSFQSFYDLLESKLAKIASAPMLNARIKSAFLNSVKDLHGMMQVSDFNNGETHKVSPALALVDAATFLTNKKMHEEVFGPFAMIIKCNDLNDMVAALPVLSGQLTITIWSDPSDTRNPDLIDEAENYAGRLVWNGVSTGVEVAAAMVHGGPYPATSNSHFTAVGNAAIYRWLRPVCYQNFPIQLLPIELKN